MSFDLATEQNPWRLERQPQRVINSFRGRDPEAQIEADDFESPLDESRHVRKAVFGEVDRRAFKARRVFGEVDHGAIEAKRGPGNPLKDSSGGQ